MENYTEEQIQEWKRKAEAWDNLDDEIASCYVDENGDEISDSENDLLTIGEIAAAAFGWL